MRRQHAPSTRDLEGVVHDTLRGFGRERLGHGRLERDALGADVLLPGRAIGQEPRRGEIRGHARELGLDQLELGDRLAEELDERKFSDFLYTAGQPDPDLLIRTSGEMRVSNFLLWQIAYSEIWVTETLWPDFRRRDLLEAIVAYQKRDRRYGGAVDVPKP